jgi:hypothetical protein
MELENRTKRDYNVIVLRTPKPSFTPLDGGDGCCDNTLVLALDEVNSWENDKTSAWMKLFKVTDYALFKLYKCDGTLASFQPSVKSFVNDTFSKYVTINWFDVLANDGVGNYYLEITYSIAGITDTFIWDNYELREYKDFLVDKTFRIKTIFNSNQSIEGIDFTNSLVEDTIRLGGYFGDRQPNMEIDNIIYQNRESKKVTRENINSYNLTTNYLEYSRIEKLIDLYLLSENEIYISDYNSTNPNNSSLDLPVIVDASPEIKYSDGAKKVQLTCKFTDKIKNSRSYY